MQQAVASGGRALNSGDVASAAGEDVERLRGEQASSQSIRAVASQLAGDDPAPASPFAAEGNREEPPFAYQLPAAAPVTDGLASVSASGVRSRGLTLATGRGMAVTAPADGVVKFAGPFRDYDGVLIIDHGGGWLSLIVNVASTLHPGDKVRLGQDPRPRARAAAGRIVPEWASILACSHRRFISKPVKGPQRRLNAGVKPRPPPVQDATA